MLSLSASLEEGPKWRKFWESGFRHPFIAPRQDFKAATCQKPASALRLRAEPAIPHPRPQSQGFPCPAATQGCHSAGDGPYFYGNPATTESRLFNTDFSRATLPRYVCSLIYSPFFVSKYGVSD